MKVVHSKAKTRLNAWRGNRIVTGNGFLEVLTVVNFLLLLLLQQMLMEGLVYQSSNGIKCCVTDHPEGFGI